MNPHLVSVVRQRAPLFPAAAQAQQQRRTIATGSQPARAPALPESIINEGITPEAAAVLRSPLALPPTVAAAAAAAVDTGALNRDTALDPATLAPNPNIHSTTTTSPDMNTVTNADVAHAAGRTYVDPPNILTGLLRAGLAAHRADNHAPLDAASPHLRPSADNRTRGNPEGIGMLEQVGSASATAAFFERGGKQGMRTGGGGL